MQYLEPQWPVPAGVHAAFTLRGGGVSRGAFASLNLGAHVGDEPAAVAQNRARVRAALGLAHEPCWLQQVHGTHVVEASHTPGREAPTADASVSRAPGVVAVVQVADCLPVLLAARDGTVAAAHAGWRGLAAGVLEATVAQMGVPPRELVAWLGPAISAAHFEVGAEVHAAFLARDARAATAFVANARGRWQCDLALLARQRLAAAGIDAVYGGTWCTYAGAGQFFSFRRDGQCGRMAALIWRD
ncbi:MAG: peptidoglycan editing factor PgeF [Proteobacteria bacterium]|nr:peptidoglycan editing factor PgeF [Pseudomonadota bacterium]